MRLLLLIGLVLAVSACEKRKPAIPETTVTNSTPAPKKDVDRSSLDKFECNRCHVIDGVEPTTVNMDCRECHRQIITGTYPEPAEYLEMWNEGLENMRDVPSLRAIDKRFNKTWFVNFVQNPHDLRPRLGATMPRMAISAKDAEALAEALGLDDSKEQAPAGDPRSGRKVLDTKGCGSCHVMTGLDTPIVASKIEAELDADTLARATLLAPDLRYTRFRFRREQLVAWLQDPAKIKPDALMPALGLSEREALDAAAFIVGVPLEPPKSAAPVERLPLLDREVRWKEVQTKLFDEICLHCHSDPKYNEGDGGPGNTGGFGFAGKKLDVSSYERAVRDKSFFAKNAEGVPKIIAHMLARHEEVAGRKPDALGMPLGFPPIDLERIQLLESWIEQGLLE